VFWSEVAAILRELLASEIFASRAVTAIATYLERIGPTLAQSSTGASLKSGHPRLSSFRTNHSKDFGASRLGFVEQAYEKCGTNPTRLNRVLALAGYIELFPKLRVEYRKGESNWTLTGSIPRTDGGVTLIVQLYAKGKVIPEFRRLPSELAQQYRDAIGIISPKGWAELDIEDRPFEQFLEAIRATTESAHKAELAPIR
jgi:hypothetical protein